MTPPVTLLRNEPTPALFTATGEPTTNLVETASVQFTGLDAPLAADTLSGYKNYTLLALLFFLQEKNMDHSTYIQKAFSYWGGRDVGTVSFLDRRDLLDYLTRVSDSSRFVTDPRAPKAADVPASTAPETTTAKPAAAKRSAEDMDLDETNENSFKKLKEEMERDWDLIKDSVIAKERVIVGLHNFMSVKATKPFTYALKYAAEILRPNQQAAPTQQPGKPGSKPVDPKARPPSTAVPSSSGKPTSSSSVPPPKDARSSSSSKPSSSSSSSKPASKPSPHARIPIIIVPPSITAALTIFNVKPFLSELKYQTTDEAIQSSFNGSSEKPSMIILDRKNPPPGFPKQYHIYDSVDRFRTDDWERIVAVFATGQEWQFKGWKLGAPVEIFARVKGFCLKFQEEPVNDKIKTWNVVQLNIHRTKRHLDTQTVNDFWLAVDAWIKEKKADRFLR